jgi:hypothetical protein
MVARRSHWPNLGRGSEGLFNTGLRKPFAVIFLFLVSILLPHRSFITLVSLYSLKHKSSDTEKFLFNPDAVIYRFCFPNSAQILMTEYIRKYGIASC